ncbi:MAG TPA: hypothetical protein PKD86_09255 [Gemmatales bacterium]|nr:hypothetical protein [Gemmatales bacterium]HMP59526.1 hypothetical protein [Gemmatales bacterium]
MKRMLTLGCRLLAIYFGTLALTVFLADALRGKRAWAWEPIHGTQTATAPTEPGEEPKKCRDCVEGWLTTVQVYGEYECPHGPELEDDCPQPPNFIPARDYFELHRFAPPPPEPPLQPPPPPCYCFRCKAHSSGLPPNLVYLCEENSLRWYAWCGLEDDDHKVGPCDVEFTSHLTVKNFKRQTRTKDNQPCRFTYNLGDVDILPWCGIMFPNGNPGASAFHCKANDQCEEFGDWEEESVGSPHIRCKRKPGEHLPPIPAPPTNTQGNP